MIAVERYQAHHFEEVAALWREAFPHDPPWNRAEFAIPEKIAFQPDLFLVALKNGTVIGSVMAGYEGHRGWISRIAVFQKYQANGIGRELLKQAEIRLSALGCAKINLQVVSSNFPATEFYARSGYVLEERVSMSKLLRNVSRSDA